MVAADIRPYRERKVRLLNGAHTVTVPAALLAGLETVHDAVSDERVGAFMRRALFDEIVPYLDVPDAEEFARDTMARFANPFIRHALIDITLYQTTKMRVRIVPSIVAFYDRTGRVPQALAFGVAAYLAFMRGDVQTERRAAGLAVPDDGEGDRVRDAWHGVDLASDASIISYARAVCRDDVVWGIDLAHIPGFAAAVGEHLVRILRVGALAAIDTLITEPAAR